MSNNPAMPKLVKLEDQPLWKETCSIAEYVYSLLAHMPDDEKWATTIKLQQSAVDMIYFVSQALGNTSPIGVEHDWSNSRRMVSALKTVYRFAGRQKFIELDPQIMVRLDKVLTEIDKQVEAAYNRTQANNEADIAHWQKKYELHAKANS